MREREKMGSKKKLVLVLVKFTWIKIAKGTEISFNPRQKDGSAALF